MERSSDDGLPQPGTEEPENPSEGDAGEGPGNVSVDEPTAAALSEDAGSPGGDDEASDDDALDDDSDSGSGDGDSSDG